MHQRDLARAVPRDGASAAVRGDALALQVEGPLLTSLWVGDG